MKKTKTVLYTGQQHADIATLTCDGGFVLTGTGFWTWSCCWQEQCVTSNLADSKDGKDK